MTDKYTELNIDELEEETLQKNEKEQPYKLYYSQVCEDVPLSKVVGHKEQKEELLLVIDWFKRSKELKEKNISIPRGVILFGEPGNGKSLLIKEIIKCCDVPVFIFQGEQDNIVDGIIKTFKKAKEVGRSIVVIDELDLLIDRSRHITRTLQECLDGVESSDDILVLAATNDISEIPDALLRNGRLEKRIEIREPSGEEALELFKRYYDEFGLKYPKDFDDEEMALLLDEVSFSAVKAIVNDLVLRNGFENISIKMIDDSICNITEKVKRASLNHNYSTAIHEAGHCVVALNYPQYFTASRVDLNNVGGCFEARNIDKYVPYEKRIASIKIAMAGVLAEKLICKTGSSGCDNDLQEARSDAYYLFNREGYSSCWEVLPGSRSDRKESQKKLRHNEKKIEKSLHRWEKETIKILKKNKDKVVKLANLLFEKKHLKSSEILACIG